MSFGNDKLTAFSCCSQSLSAASTERNFYRGLFSVDPHFFLSASLLLLHLRFHFHVPFIVEIGSLIHIDCLLYANIYINDTPRTLWNNFGNVYAAIGLANLRSSSSAKSMAYKCPEIYRFWVLRILATICRMYNYIVFHLDYKFLCFRFESSGRNHYGIKNRIYISKCGHHVKNRNARMKEKNITEGKWNGEHKQSSDEWENIEIKGSFKLCVFVCVFLAQMFWTSFPFVQLNFSECAMANGLFSGSNTERKKKLCAVFLLALSRTEIFIAHSRRIMQSQKQAFKLWGKGDSVVEQQQNIREFFFSANRIIT